MYGWEHWHDSGGDWMWWLMMIGIILLWIGVIALVVWLVRTWTAGRPVTGGTPAGPPQTTGVGPQAGGAAATFAAGSAGTAMTATPQQILARRYAEGTIDRDDYLRRKADLEQGLPASPAAGEQTPQGDPEATTLTPGAPAAGDPQPAAIAQGGTAVDDPDDATLIPGAPAADPSPAQQSAPAVDTAADDPAAETPAQDAR